MRFGGPTFREVNDPEAWITELKRLNYSATYWLSVDDKDEALAGAFERSAKQADIVIAEVHIFNNPIDSDDQRRKTTSKINYEVFVVPHSSRRAWRTSSSDKEQN